MTPAIITAAGKHYLLPTDNPLLAKHLADPASHADTILRQINEQRLYSPFINPSKAGMTFLDIGANIGLVSIFAHDVCSRVVAVEPCKAHFDILELLLRPLRLEFIFSALAPETGNVKLFRSTDNTTMHSIVNACGDCDNVPGWTLIDLMDFHFPDGVDFVKIDIEGAEEICLPQSQIEACAHRIDSYFIECHDGAGTSWNEKLQILSARLRAVGYNVSHPTGDSVHASKL